MSLVAWAQRKYGTDLVPDGANVTFDFEYTAAYDCCGGGAEHYFLVYVNGKQMPGDISAHNINELIAEIKEAL